MRVLSESVGFLPENGRFSLRISWKNTGNARVFEVLMRDWNGLWLWFQ